MGDSRYYSRQRQASQFSISTFLFSIFLEENAFALQWRRFKEIQLGTFRRRGTIFFKENYQPPAHVLLGKTSNLLPQNVHYLYKEEDM